MKKGFSKNQALFMFFMSFMFFMAGRSNVPAQPQQKPPVFRTGIDLRQLDVTVLDRDRHPVKGLTAADFKVTEEGVDQKVEAFSFVDLGKSVASTAPTWASKVPSDVVSNDLESARVFAIIVDDVYGMGDLWAKREMPKSVATFVNQLGPDDIAALVFTGRADRSVNFTRDKAKLINALDWYATSNETAVGAKGACSAKLRQPETFLYVAENLRAMKNRRKAIVFFGGVMTFCDGTSDCGECEMWQKYVQTARESNVSVYPVDTMGLRPGSQRRADAYLSLAGYVGGHAVINNNSFTEGLTRIFEENTSYYLLAYQPTNPEDNGRFRRVVVKVNRPGVEVTSTRSYWAPRPVSPKHPMPTPLAADAESVTGVLPLSQMPMRATAAPFRTDGAAAVIAVSMHVDTPAFAERTRENVDVLVRKFTVDGIDYGSDRQLVSVAVPPAPEGGATSAYELLARVEVPKPGHYELRISAHSEASDTRGSIYIDVDVPDFQRERLSLSGVLVSALSGMPVGSPGLFADVSPAPPATIRTFAAADRAISMLRIYQGGTDKLAAVTMKVGIQDAAGKSVFSQSDSVGLDRFNAERSADYQFRLPLDKLGAGQYLLTFETVAGKSTARRDVRFEKR